MKKYFICLVLILQIACSSSAAPEHNTVVDNKTNSKTDCPSISEETAVLVAEGYMFRDYELNNYAAKVETESKLYKEYGEMWRVSFISKTKDTFGDPVVWVAKRDGKVLTVKHAK
jgi:hypothetical protein